MKGASVKRVSVAAAAVVIAAMPAESFPQEITIDLGSGLGSCFDRERRSIDLRRVMILENRMLDTGAGRSARRIHLSGQIIRVTRLPEDEDDQAISVNVGRLVGRDGQVADVDIKLALHNNDIALYWRETFKHRIYRQGLFRIIDRQLVSLCEGTAGLQSTR